MIPPPLPLCVTRHHQEFLSSLPPTGVVLSFFFFFFFFFFYFFFFFFIIITPTTRPDIIDPAMLRPGRLDKLLEVAHTPTYAPLVR